jgi:uncharacterized protein (DUF433 family)
MQVIMEIATRIVVDDKIRFGKPVIKKTRVPADLVLSKLAGGATYGEVKEEYDLTREDILAVLDYAANSE